MTLKRGCKAIDADQLLYRNSVRLTYKSMFGKWVTGLVHSLVSSDPVSVRVHPRSKFSLNLADYWSSALLGARPQARHIRWSTNFHIFPDFYWPVPLISILCSTNAHDDRAMWYAAEMLQSPPTRLYASMSIPNPNRLDMLRDGRVHNQHVGVTLDLLTVERNVGDGVWRQTSIGPLSRSIALLQAIPDMIY